MSCVYFLQAGVGGPIKIGFTKGNPENRIRALQVASPVKLILIGTANGNNLEEKLLHFHLCGHRLIGEWFHPAPQVMEAIANAMKGEFPRKPKVEQPPKKSIAVAVIIPKPKKSNLLNEIFDAFGGATRLAKAIGISPIHAQTMKTRKSIPVGYWWEIVEAAKQHEIGGITVEKLIYLHHPEAIAP